MKNIISCTLLMMIFGSLSIVPESTSAAENEKDLKDLTVICETNNNTSTLKVININNKKELDINSFKNPIAGLNPEELCNSFASKIQSHINKGNEKLIFSTDIIAKKPTLCLQDQEGDCSNLAQQGGEYQPLLQLNGIKDSDLPTSEINQIFNDINVNKGKTTISLTQRNYESPRLSFNIWDLLF